MTTRVGQFQKKHSPTHTHPDHRTSFINFLHLLRSTASSMFSLRVWQSSLTTSLQVLFGLPLGLGPFTSYSMHFFTQTSSSFHSTCPYQRSLFCCNTNASIPIVSLSTPYLQRTWPSYSLLPHLLTFSTYHNLVFSYWLSCLYSPRYLCHLLSSNTRWLFMAVVTDEFIMAWR